MSFSEDMWVCKIYYLISIRMVSDLSINNSWKKEKE